MPDGVGADVPAAVRVVAPGGARAVFDLGAPGLRDPARLLRRGGTLVLPERGPDRRSPAELRADLLAVLDQLASGAIAARIARAFALHRIAEAVAYAGSGRAEGAVVVVGAVGPEC